MEQAIAWTNVVQVPWCHMASVYNELIFLYICNELLSKNRQVSNIRRTKSQHLKDSRTVLRLSEWNDWHGQILGGKKIVQGADSI